MNLYLSGPMTGIDGHNVPAFKVETARLRALGHKVVSPAENYLEHPFWTREEYLRWDISQLMMCDKLAYLPGSHESEGATLEMYVADKCGIERIASYRIVGPVMDDVSPPIFNGPMWFVFLAMAILAGWYIATHI